MNLNKAFILGRLTRDPERKQLPSGLSVTNFGMATNRFYTTKEGEKREDTEFHNIVIFGKMAETATTYLKKGSLVLIEGRVQTRSWDDAATGQKKYRTEIVAEKMQLGPRSANTGAQGDFTPTPTPAFASSPAPTPNPSPQQAQQPTTTIKEEDIPVIQEETPIQSKQETKPESVEAPTAAEKNELPNNPFEKKDDEIDVKNIPF